MNRNELGELTFTHTDRYMYTEAQARRQIEKWRHPNYSECVPYGTGVVLSPTEWKAKMEAMLPWADALEAALNAFLKELAHAPA